MFTVNRFALAAVRSFFVAGLALVSLTTAGFAAQPIVKTVPWMAADSSVPHDTFAFKTVTLKGTSSLQGSNIRATWDFGDGSARVTSPVTDSYNVAATHAYTGAPGTTYTARLTVTDQSTGEYSFATYAVIVREQTLETAVNVAIDEGLWYLHTSMNRSGATGNWQGTSCFACDSTGEATAWNVLAFERNGHLGTGDSADPYTETVARAHAAVLAQMSAQQPVGAIWERAAHITAVDKTATKESTAAAADNASAAAPSGLDAADAATLVSRQSALGYWLGNNPASTAGFETAQSLFALSATPIIHLAGANSVTNVSSQVQVTNTGFTFNRATSTYGGNLTVKNITLSTIAAPITVGITNLPATVVLTNSNGTFNTAPYRTITASPLLAGASVTVPITFSNPNNLAITFNRFTYSGNFPPAALTLACSSSSATQGTPYNSSLDANGGVLPYTYTISIGTLPAGLSIDANTGAITGTPTTSGNVSFTATVTDSAGQNGQVTNQSCNINVINPNQPPVANGQTTSTLEDTPVTIILTGSDPESNPLTFSIVSGPTSGSLGPIVPINSTSASVQYTPAANFNGAASFTFKVNDGTSNSVANATVTINITAVNDAPSFTKGPDETVNQNSGAHTVNPWATAISAGPADESGQTLSFNITGNTNPALFSVAPAVSPAGVLTYTLAAAQSGTSTITLTLQDTGGTANGGLNTSAPQSFIINVSFVNSVPSFTKGPDKTVLEDAGAQTFAGWATGISPGPPSDSGQTVNFNITGNTNAALFSAGPAVSSTGTLTFTPTANANGTATITLVAQDNGGTSGGGVDTSAPQTFVINVTAVNDAPSFTKGADQTVNEDSGAQTVPGWATAISAGPADESGQVLTFNVTGNTNAALFSAAPAIASNGQLTYTPAANASGTATITITLSDNGGTANSGLNTSAPQSFVINVNNVNDAPSFTKGVDQTVNEDAGAQTVVGWATAISAGPPSESGQVLTFNVTGNTNGALFSAGPAIAANGTLTYTPAANANGTANITITLSDNGGTANGGIDTSAPQSFNITVNAVNDAPTFTKGADQTVNEDSGPQTVVGWATAMSPGPADESGQTLAFSITGNTNGALFSAAPAVANNGDLTYTPAANANGTATITVRLTDSGSNTAPNVNFSEQTFIITVNAVNDAPSFTKGADQTVNEDAGPQTVNPWATALSKGPANESGQTLSFVITANTNSGLFSAGPSVSAAGVLTYTPAANQNGTATITLHIHDDGTTANGGVDNSGDQTFVINVTAVNDPPTALAKAYAAHANMPISIGAGAGLLVGAADANDNGVNGCVSTTFAMGSVSATSPSGGIVASNPDGSFTFTPPAGFTGGPVTFTYTVTDTGCPSPAATSAAATVTFTVSGPVIWFVDPNAASNGDGRLGTPFKFLSGNAGANNDADDVDAANHRIFIYNGTSSTGIALNTGEWLIGQPVAGSDFDTLMGITPPAGTLARPAIATGTVTVQNTVTVNTNVIAKGFNLSTGGNTGLADPATAITGVTVDEMSITSTTGTAVNLSSNGGTYNLRSISANGAANGISLTSTTGSFTVTGNAGTCTSTASTCTGGTLQNMTGNAISLNSAQNLSFSFMKIMTVANSGIGGTGVANFVLTNSVIDGVNTAHTGNDGNVSFNLSAGGSNENNLSGTVSITNNTLNNSYQGGIDILNYAGTISSLTITGNSFTSSTSTSSSFGSAVNVYANKNNGGATVASVTAGSISNNTILNFPVGAGIQVLVGNTGAGPVGGLIGSLASPLLIQDNTITGNGPGAAGIGTNGIAVTVGHQSDGFFTIGASGHPNTITNVKGNGIACSKFGNDTGSGADASKCIIAFNVINANNTSNSAGINTGADSATANTNTPRLYLDIHNNNVSNTTGNGILSTIRSTDGTGIFHIENNTVVKPTGPSVYGIRADAGNGSESAGATVCLKINGNTTEGSTNASATIKFPGIGLRQQHTAPVSAFQIEGLSPTPANDTQMQTYVSAQNPASVAGTFGTGGTASISSGATFTAGTCTIP